MIIFSVNLLIPHSTKGLQKPDAVMGSTVHLLAAWAGYRLSKRYKVPFIYEIRDVWPDALIHLGKLAPNSFVARKMHKLSVELARRANLVVAPLPKIDLYLEKNGIDTSKFRWISNGFSPKAKGKISYPQEGIFTFMYLGSHGNANALDGIMEAFDRFCLKRPDASARLRFIGDGPLKKSLQKQRLKLKSYNYISFEDSIPQHQVTERSREASCLVANLHDSPVYEFGISPNKLFTYLHAARPIIFACSAPNNPISEANAGIVVPGDNRVALSQAMEKMYDMSAQERKEIAKRGYKYLFSNFTYEILTEQLAEALKSVVPNE
jgi:glycosyltransferase involved in cell wall biosynthesis